MSDAIGTVESENSVHPQATIRSQAAQGWHELSAEVWSDTDIMYVWNGSVSRQTAYEAKAPTKSAKTLVVHNYQTWRDAFWKVNEVRMARTFEKMPDGTITLRSTRSQAKPVAGKPPVKAIRKEPTPDVTGLSETEKAILLGSRPMTPAAVTEITTVVETAAIPESERDEMLRAIEEADAAAKKQQDFMVWSGRKADSEADAMRSRKGEGLWANAVTVEAFPDDPAMKIILVRSSTAPLMGTHGPTVKHDFRANGVPVNHKHNMMIRQNNGEKLIRSRVLQPKKHEFYAKGLQYQDGMFFKGYFEVDGVEQPNLTRYYVCRGNDVTQITESEYRDLENQAAAHPRN